MNEAGFSYHAVALSVAAAVLARCILSPALEQPVRTQLLLGLPLAFALGCAAAFFCETARKADLFGGRGVSSRLVCLGFACWFAVSLVATVGAAQQICWEQFSSQAVLGLVPLLLWAGWSFDGAVLARTARILWWIVLAGAVLCLLGLGGQLHWQNLAPGAPAQLALPTVPLFPEFFALPLLCPAASRRKSVALPVGAFLLEVGYGFGMELLFGPERENTVLGYELLRAWTLGAFSRFDAFLLLVWLAAALFRICLLARVLHVLLGRLWGDAAARGEVQP